MKLSTALFTSALAIGLTVAFTAPPAEAAKVKGNIQAVMKEGRSVTIGGKTYFTSGSRTNICIKGACDQDRGKLKKGMKCSGTTSTKKKGMELKKISCK